jgi:hypothetical protein
VILLDANVLIAAFRPEDQRHDAVRDAVVEVLDSGRRFATPDVVLAAFVRITTNPRLFRPATPPAEALAITTQLRDHPSHRAIAPGHRFWQIFVDTCTAGKAHGPLVTDAYLAALAIEHGCELWTFDRDFARFPGLRWRPPVA